MERETKDVTLPTSKSKVVVKQWLTAREEQEIESVMYKAMKMELKGDKRVNVAPIDGSSILDRERKCMETVVLSLEGKTENISDRLLDLRKGDYNFLKEEVMKVSMRHATEDHKYPDTNETKQKLSSMIKPM